MAVQQNMNDRELVEDILLTSKQLSSLYHSAVSESSTESVHNQFKCNMNETVDMQHTIFKQMEQKGWYPQEKAEQQKIDKVKMKYSAQ